MRDHRCLFVATVVSALSLQSSVGEGGDGALRWSGLTTRAAAHWACWCSADQAGGTVGYILNVWRVDFQRLLAVPGSRDRGLLEALLPELEDADEEASEVWRQDREADDSDPEDFIASADALRQILDGTIPSGEVRGSPYVSALIRVYEYLGRYTGDMGPFPSVATLVSQWDAAMQRAGITASFFALSSRGAPFPCPPDEPFPTIGYMTPAEVCAADRAIRGVRQWPFFWRTRVATPEMDPEAVAMFGSWVAKAARKSEGLVGVLG
jgi:hypothetical protein